MSDTHLPNWWTVWVKDYERLLPDRWEWGHQGRPCPARPPEDGGFDE